MRPFLLTNAVLRTTDCAIDDFACYCQPANNALIVNSATPCVVKQCNAAKVPRTINLSKALCTRGNRNAAGGVVGNGDANGVDGTGVVVAKSASKACDQPMPTFTSLEALTPSQTAAPVARSSGLSAGAKVGLAIGVIAFLAILAFLFCRRRQRRRYKNPEPFQVIENNNKRLLDMRVTAMSMQEFKCAQNREPVEVDGQSGMGGRKMSEMSASPSFAEKAPPPPTIGDGARRDSATSSFRFTLSYLSLSRKRRYRIHA